MKREAKRLMACLLVCLFVATAFIGCGKKEENTDTSSKTTTEQTATSGEKRKVTDSAGREVEIPKEIKRVAPSGALAQIVLFSISPDKIIGWSKTPSEATKKYMDEKYWNLPEFGQFYGKNVSLNIEALIKSKPDVIIDIGDKKKTIKEDMDGVQKQTGIPTIFIEGTLENVDKAYETLGDILGEKETSKALGEYASKTVKEVKEKAASIPENKRVSVYYGVGENGLNTNAKGSIHADVIDIVGANNVAVLESISSKGGGSEISMEQLLKWNPDRIVFSPDANYDKVGTDKAWKDLKAIKDGKYYETPMGPYNWMGSPPSVNRLIGIKWLGNLLYPDVFNYDMIKETKEFYKLFYKYDLKDDEAKKLLSKSTFK